MPYHWAYGIKQLGKHTQGAVKMINKIGEEFGKLDHDLAESLKTKKKGKQSWPASAPPFRT